MQGLHTALLVGFCVGLWSATALAQPEQDAANPANEGAGREGTAATPDETRRARDSFQAGVDAYGRSQWRIALDHFKTAMRLKPHPVLHVNLANCYDKLGDPIQALGHFKRYLSYGIGTPQQRAEVEEAIARLEGQLGTLSVMTIPDTATISIDGAPVGSSPLRKRTVTAGTHELTVRAPGYESITRRVEVNARGNATVTMQLTRAATAGVAGAPLPTEPGPAPAPTTAGVDGAGVDGAGVDGAGVDGAGVDGAGVDGAGVDGAGVDGANAARASGTVHGAAGADGGANLVVVPTEPTATASADGMPARASTADPWSRPALRWTATGVTGALLLGALITGALASSAEGDFEENRTLALDTDLSQRVRRNAWNHAMDDADRANGLATASDVLLVSTAIVGGAAAYLWAIHWRSLESADGTSAHLLVLPERAGVGGSIGLRGQF